MSDWNGHIRYGWTKMIDLRKQFRKNPTRAEDLLWESLRDRRLNGEKFRRQHGIGRYVVDFYHGQSRTIIEVDGSVHQSKDVRDNDRIRQKYLEDVGNNFLRFTNKEVLEDTQNVLKTILIHLNNFSSSSPDKEGGLKALNYHNCERISSALSFICLAIA